MELADALNLNAPLASPAAVEEPADEVPVDANVEDGELEQSAAADDDAVDDAADDNIFTSDSDGDDADDDIVVRIGDVQPTVPFASMQKGVTAAGTGAALGGTTAAGKLDVDKVAELDGVPIYDADIASMTEKPWRKPGADITDYFNYGFSETTWNSYCERQRKLRAHYGNDQSAANKKLFGGMSLVAPTSTSAVTNSNVTGHQRAQQKLEEIAKAQGTIKVTRIGPSGIEMTAEVLASELTGGGNATSALAGAPNAPQRISTVNLAADKTPSSISVMASAIVTTLPPPMDDGAATDDHSQPPPAIPSQPPPAMNMPNMNLPPPMFGGGMASAPPSHHHPGGGYGAPPGYNAAPPMHYGAPPGAGGYGFKQEMPHEAASYSDTSDIDEPTGPPMHMMGRQAPPGAGYYGGGPPGGGGHYNQGPPQEYARRPPAHRGGYQGRQRSPSPIRPSRSSRRVNEPASDSRGSKRAHESERDHDKSKRSGGGSSKRGKRDNSDDERRSRRSGRDKIKSERDSD